MTQEIRIKSVIPVYGVAAVFVLYAVLFPLYRPLHFLVLGAVAVFIYLGLAKLFPGRTEVITLPIETGTPEIDELLREGERAVSQMRTLALGLSGESVRSKVYDIIEVTERIYKDVIDDPSDYKTVKRFNDHYLPMTLKFLHTYDRLGKSGVEGENITGTIQKIDEVLSVILNSYRKLFDALFENQALDIETDITVLQTLLKREGLSE